MGININDICDKLMEPETMEKKLLFNIPKYIIHYGGGIYWAIFYFVFYLFFVYELMVLPEHIDHGVLVAVIILGILGVFLAKGIYSHIHFLKKLKKHLQDWADNKEKEYQEKNKNIDDEYGNFKTDISLLYTNKDAWCSKNAYDVIERIYQTAYRKKI